MVSLRRVLIFFVVLGWAAGVSAEIYEWIDAEGVRRFSNKPLPIGVTPVDRIEELPFDAMADSVRRDKDNLEMQQLFEHWRLERQIEMEQQEAEQRRVEDGLRQERMSHRLEEAKRWNRFYDSYFGPSYVPVFPPR